MVILCGIVRERVSKLSRAAETLKTIIIIVMHT